MKIKSIDDFEYVLADPTGNITALVTSKVEDDSKQFVVREIFKAEPSCEQVGFVEPISDKEIKLEMMGGEFCGNAALCAAAYLAELNLNSTNLNSYIGAEAGGPDEYLVYSSGIAAPVNIQRFQPSAYVGTLKMPYPTIVLMTFDNQEFPLVKLEGIYHMLIPADTISEAVAESIIRPIADKFDIPAFGLILYQDSTISASAVTIKPLVYVKESDTLVWEHGCASGSIAAGYFKYQTGTPAAIDVLQPGGIISITVNDDKLLLTGAIKF